MAITLRVGDNRVVVCVRDEEEAADSIATRQTKAIKLRKRKERKRGKKGKEKPEAEGEEETGVICHSHLEE